MLPINAFKFFSLLPPLMPKTGGITSLELNEKMGAGEPVQIIDVRSEQDYLMGHIPGSINLPLSHFARDISTITFQPSIVVVCAGGEPRITLYSGYSRFLLAALKASASQR